MKALCLRRKWFDDERTIGALSEQSYGHICYTLEPSYSDTFPLIAPGVYELEPHSGPRFKDTWAIVGNGITHYPAGGSRRSTVLFHQGNLDEESRGCILLGLSIGRLNGEDAVLQSRAAMNLLRTVLGSDRATLTIFEEN